MRGDRLLGGGRGSAGPAQTRARRPRHDQPETNAELEACRLLCILGVRERSGKMFRDLVPDNSSSIVPLTLTKRRKSVDYEAKVVQLAGRRQIVYHNLREAEKDQPRRCHGRLGAAIGEGRQVARRHTGYRRFLTRSGDDHFTNDRVNAYEVTKFGGIFVLRTNIELSPLEWTRPAT